MATTLVALGPADLEDTEFHVRATEDSRARGCLRCHEIAQMELPKWAS